MGKPFSRNSLCWCGSGVKYKKCHMRREDQKSLPLRAINSISDKGSRVRLCMHPEASESACAKIINAHSIQRSRLLEQVVNSNNKILKLVPAQDEQWGAELKEIGWRHASTFTGFCSTHDSSTFEVVERCPFDATPEQCFLLAYRGLCHELHAKLQASKSVSPLKDFVDRGQTLSEQVRLQSELSRYQYWLEMGLEETKSAKLQMDAQLQSRAYEEWSHWIVLIDGPLSIVTTGSFTPSRDLSGDLLQDFTDESKPLERVIISMAPTKTGNAAMFSWRTCDAIPIAFLRELRQSRRTRLPDLLTQVIFQQCENAYFSHSWWDGLTEDEQAKVKRWALTFDEEAHRLGVEPACVSPWSVSSMIEVNTPGSLT